MDYNGCYIDWDRLPLKQHAWQTILGWHSADTLPTLGWHYSHLVGSCYWVLSSLLKYLIIFCSPLRGTLNGRRLFLIFHAGNIHLCQRPFFSTILFSCHSFYIMQTSLCLKRWKIEEQSSLQLSTATDCLIKHYFICQLHFFILFFIYNFLPLFI